jgi:hypothetical protein
VEENKNNTAICSREVPYMISPTVDPTPQRYSSPRSPSITPASITSHQPTANYPNDERKQKTKQQNNPKNPLQLHTTGERTRIPDKEEAMGFRYFPNVSIRPQSQAQLASQQPREAITVVLLFLV